MLSGFVSVPGAQIYHEVYTPEQTQQKQQDIPTLMCKFVPLRLLRTAY